MAEPNLIPPEYTRRQNLRKAVNRFVYFCAALLLLLAAGRTGLSVASNQEKSRAEKLRSGEVLMLEQKQKYDELTARKNELRIRLDMLEKLRGGPPAREMFIIIDRAINESVWFTKLSFARAVDEDGESPKGIPTGYFVVVPKEERQKAQERAQQKSGQITINGMALNHSALADFVNELVAQPLIKTVQVQNTRSRRYLETSVIEYELTAAMIANNAEK